MADDPQIDQGSPPDLGGIVNAVGVWLQDGLDVGGYMDWFINNISKARQVVRAVDHLSIDTIGTAVTKKLQSMLGSADEFFGQFVAFALAIIFGGDAAAAFKDAGQGGGDLQSAAAATGGAILAAVFGPLSLDGSEELTPGVDRAEAYLGAIGSMVMRGFILSAATEWIPAVDFHAIAELEEELIHGLGLGRIARTVLHPIVTTLVADPAQWAINLAYRPKLHSEADAVKLWELGELDDGALDDELGRAGWSAPRIEHFKDLHLKPLDFESGMVLATHGVLSEDDVMNGLLHEGFLRTAAEHRIAAWHLKRVDLWNEKLIALLIGQYERGVIDEGVFRTSLRATGRPDDELQAVMNLAGASVEVPNVILSEAHLLAAWKQNVITQNEFAAGLKKLRWADADITTVILTQLAAGQHASELAAAKAKVIADRQAAAAQAKADRLAAAHAKAIAAALAHQQKLEAAAAAKAQAAQDAEARRQFIATAAEQRRALVAAATTANAIDKDHAAALAAQITTDEKALLANVTSQETESTITFERAQLELADTLRESALETALADVDLAAEETAAARQDGVTVRLGTVDALLALKLAEVDALFTARAQNATDDLAAAIAAIVVAMQPTVDERAGAAQIQITALDDALARKLADIDTHTADQHAAVADELAKGNISAKTAANDDTRIETTAAQAKRLASQQHDLGVTRLQNAGAASSALAAATAEKDKTNLETAAAKAAKTLAAEKLAAELAARHDADAERVRLQAITAQAGPLSAASVQAKKKALTDAAAKAAAQDALKTAAIDHQEAIATANAGKAEDAVVAAQRRLALLESSQTVREAAAADAVAKLAAFDAATNASRAQLEATIISHKVGTAPLVAPAPQ
jgi:hypothetical protein